MGRCWSQDELRHVRDFPGAIGDQQMQKIISLSLSKFLQGSKFLTPILTSTESSLGPGPTRPAGLWAPRKQKAALHSSNKLNNNLPTSGGSCYNSIHVKLPSAPLLTFAGRCQLRRKSLEAKLSKHAETVQRVFPNPWQSLTLDGYVSRQSG